jgi:hypothetical protein
MKDHTKFILDFLKEKPNQYTRKEVADIASQAMKFPISLDTIHHISKSYNVRHLFKESDIKNQYHYRPAHVLKKREQFKPNVKKRDTTNVLIIGDLHEPFCLLEYLDLCKETYTKYNCTHVIFIGDIVDNHFSSYHETDPDGFSALDEFLLATNRIDKWIEAFPQADVVRGNHDRLIMRKAKTGGISSVWLRDYAEVLNAPGWNFQEEFVYDNVRYIHGEQGTARNRAKKDLISTVQGHRHTEAYTEHIVGQRFHIFGTQVGCGVDRKAYAMAYAQAGPKPVIGCAVVLDHGSLPINILAEL